MNYKKVVEGAFNSLQLSGIISELNGGKMRLFSSKKENLQEIEKVLLLYKEKIEDIIHLYAFLKEESRNVVVVGPNGSGKTRLIKRLKNITGKDQVFFGQADRLFLFKNNQNIPISVKVAEQNVVNNNQYSEDANTNRETYISMQFSNIISLFNRYRFSELEQKIPIKKMKTTLIIKIWNKLICDRKLIFKDYLRVTVDGKTTSEYSLNDLSNGEKTILYFLASIILLTPKQFYFIDEPENNLNPSIVSLLWDEIEATQSKAVFVYLTHSSVFASSRVNSKIYWMKKYEKNTFDYESLPENDNLPQELMIELVGNRGTTLFCESQNESKYDTKIYKLMFPNFKIVSSGGCDKVIAKTKSYKLAGLNGKAYGIIDCDYKLQSHLNGLKKHRVFYLPFFEIENFMISKEIINCVIQKYCINTNDTFDNIFTKIKKGFDKNKEIWIIRNIASELRYTYFKKKVKCLKKYEELEAIFKKFNNENKIQILKKKYEKRFQRVKILDDYDTYLRYYDNKNNLFAICNSCMTFKEPNDYENALFDFLKSDDGLKLLSDLRIKYFPKIV